MKYINQSITKSYSKLSGKFKLLFSDLYDLSDVKWPLFIFRDRLLTYTGVRGISLLFQQYNLVGGKVGEVWKGKVKGLGSGRRRQTCHLDTYVGCFLFITGQSSYVISRTSFGHYINTKVT